MFGVCGDSREKQFFDQMNSLIEMGIPGVIP